MRELSKHPIVEGDLFGYDFFVEVQRITRMGYPVSFRACRDMWERGLLRYGEISQRHVYGT